MKKKVRFLRHCRPYNAGEVAFIDPAKANVLVHQGFAEMHEDKPVEEKKPPAKKAVPAKKAAKKPAKRAKKAAKRSK